MKTTKTKLCAIFLLFTLFLCSAAFTGCQNTGSDEDSSLSPSESTSDPDESTTDTESESDSVETEPWETEPGETEPGETESQTPVEGPEEEGDPEEFFAALTEFYTALQTVFEGFFPRQFPESAGNPSGSIALEVNNLSLFGKDLLNSNSYSFTSSYAIGESGLAADGILSIKSGDTTENAGINCFVTSDGSIFLCLPAVDPEKYILLDLSELISLLTSSSGGLLPGGTDTGNLPGFPTPLALLPEIPAQNIEGVSLTKRTATATILDKEYNSLQKYTLKVDPSILSALFEEDSAGSLSELIPGDLAELLGQFAEGLESLKEFSLSIYLEYNRPIRLELGIYGETESLVLLFDLIAGNEGAAFEGSLTLTDETGASVIPVSFSGSQGNGARPSGKITVTIDPSGLTSSDSDSGNADSSYGDLLSGSGKYILSLSYTRESSEKETNTVYEFQIGMDAGIGSITLRIPVHVKAQTADDGTVSLSVSIDTKKDNISELLLHINLGFTLTRSPAGTTVEVTPPTPNENQIISVTDPDDNEALQLYLQAAKERFKLLAESLESFLRLFIPETPQEVSELSGRYIYSESLPFGIGTVETVYEFSGNRVTITPPTGNPVTGTYRIENGSITFTTDTESTYAGTYTFLCYQNYIMLDDMVLNKA